MNELNESTYRFFGFNWVVSWVRQARIGHGNARGVLWACVVLAKRCEGHAGGEHVVLGEGIELSFFFLALSFGVRVVQVVVRARVSMVSV